jgi:AbrB family looped-hinge helix DNA binding protein
MSEFEEHVMDLETVSKLIKAACHHVEGLEVDKALNLLIAADELLSHQGDIIYTDFQKAWKEFMTPQHNPETWTTEIDEDGVLTIPDHIMDKLGWEENDLLEVNVLNDGTISITLAEDQQDEPGGCMGDELTAEEQETLKTKGVLGLTPPWEK